MVISCGFGSEPGIESVILLWDMATIGYSGGKNVKESAYIAER